MAFDFEHYLNKKVLLHLFPKNELRYCANGLLKKHTQNLGATGDFSFPVNLEVLANHIKSGSYSKESENKLESYDHMSSTIKERIESLKENSQSWVYPLRDICIRSDRCHLYVDRLSAFKVMFNELFQKRVVASDEVNQLYIEEKQWSEDMPLSCYRVYLISKVLKRIAIYSGWNVVTDPNEDCLKVELREAQKSQGKDGFKYIPCGLVLDPASKKRVSLTYSEYKKLRSTDMQLMAMHKYGIRIHDPVFFRSLVNDLGQAAVIVDFLEVKATSPVLIKQNGHGSTRGAAFILYNSSRIESLLKSFEMGVRDGKFIALPSLDQIDLTMLKEEDEWQLLFSYILPFPQLVKRCLLDIEAGKCSIHLICQFLNGLVAVFSSYYRRTRVLVESRKHLIPAIHARIYLLKAVREVLITILHFFGISPMQSM